MENGRFFIQLMHGQADYFFFAPVGKTSTLSAASTGEVYM